MHRVVMQLVLTFTVYTIYKRVPLFGLDFYVVQKHPLNLSLTGKKLENSPVKIYLQLYLEYLQNRILSY